MMTIYSFGNKKLRILQISLNLSLYLMKEMAMNKIFYFSIKLQQLKIMGRQHDK